MSSAEKEALVVPVRPRALLGLVAIPLAAAEDRVTVATAAFAGIGTIASA